MKKKKNPRIGHWSYDEVGKGHHLQCQNPIGVLAQVLAVPLLIQIHAYASGRAAGDSISAWAPVSHVGDWSEAFSSWLRSGSSPWLV